MTIRNLDCLLHPRSVAVIGGSQRASALGQLVLSNLVDGGFDGALFAVNPKQVDMEGVHWAATIAALPETPDMAVIVTPAHTVAGIVAELGARGTRVAVIISAEPHDEATRTAILEAARPHLLRLVGPNCLGVLMPHAKLNASFAPRRAEPGRLAFVSQSGALVTAMLDWAGEKKIGFSGVVSAGDMADVDLGDLIDLFAADPKTDAILLYIEGVTNPAKFMSAARAASRIKPVIAIKTGRSDAAGRAALSHTGALTGSYDVYAAAFHRAGIILVDSLTELFDAAQVLCQHQPRCGERLAIVSNGGGAGVLAADALPATGGRLATLHPETIAALEPQMPAAWSRANPIDVVGDARAERFAVASKAALLDPDVDALMVIHCPTAVAAGFEIARGVIEMIEAADPHVAKPVIACWMGTGNAASVRGLFDAAGIPLFDNLDDAVRGYGYLLQARKGHDALMCAPATISIAESDRARARAVITGARNAGRTQLSACEAKAVVGAYGVPCVPGILARSAEAVTEACARVDAPYVIKLVSPQFPHKSDIGGVALDIAEPEEAATAARAMAVRFKREHPTASVTGFEVEPMIRRRDGSELLAGIARDPTFGPVIAFGAGGKAVEMIHDRALGLPPLDDALAGEMIAATRIARILNGYRDVPAVRQAEIVKVLNALSAIAVDFPEIAELDINPLVADSEGVIALDVRISLSGAEAAPLVIRPIPMQWAARLTTRAGVTMEVRPVRPDDEAALADFFHHVSPDDLRFRFLTGLREVGRDRLAAMTQIDYRRTMNFLAFAEDGMLIATAMLACDPDGERAELAVSVRSDFKARGVSWTLVQHVLDYARSEGIKTVDSVESTENHAALALEREAGFAAVPGESSGTEITVRRELAAH